MTGAIDDIRKPAFKRIRKTGESPANEVPKLIYSVIVNKYRQQKKEPEVESKQEIDKTEAFQQLGLPPQPKEYLKFPDYDCF